MNRRIFPITLIFIFVYLLNQSLTADSPDKNNLTLKVDSFISTGGNRYVCGFNNPGATVPFGLIRLSPDTISLTGETAINTSGYYYHDPKILGFSHTRLCGTGAVDGGHFRVIPDSKGTPLNKLRRGMKAPLSHQHESASPGYYSINFPEHGLKAELTTTERTALHRYHFAPETMPSILFDVGSTLGRGKSKECELQIDSKQNMFTGSTRTFGSFSGRYGGLKVYFAAKFRKPWSRFSTWSGTKISQNNLNTKGDDVGAHFVFPQKEEKQVLELAVSISHVSVSNAIENMNQELGNLTFSEIQKQAIKKWNEKFSLMKVEGGTESDQKIFYTALYHSLMMPTIFNDVNKEYTGFDKKTHKANDFQYYTDMSLWDTYRTTHPLYTLIMPDIHRDMIVSLVKMAKQGGNFPRWPSGTGFTNSMFGAPTEIAIVEAYLKGIRNFDVKTAYQIMKKAALKPAPKGAPYSGRRGIDEYIKFGYCPSDKMDGAVSKTLEYSSTDAAIAKLADSLNKTEDAQLFKKRSNNYRNAWNPKTQYFQPRDSSGKFSTPLKPLLLTYVDFGGKYTNDFVEGSALQWRWAVSHDTSGLISLFKSRNILQRS